jgi:hypothetical protein
VDFPVEEHVTRDELIEQASNAMAHEVERLRIEEQRWRSAFVDECRANDRLVAAMRKALAVWHNYRIDSTDKEREIEAECKALVGDQS